MYAPFAINVFARAVYLGFSGRGGVEDPESLHARATSVDSVMSTDTLAEWLRRRPAKPMGSPRVGSNPTGVVSLMHSIAMPNMRGANPRVQMLMSEPAYM